MDRLAEWDETVSILDACLKPIAHRPIDIRDPDWFAKLSAGPNPLDDAGVRMEAETLLMEVIRHYPEGDPAARQAIRELFARNPSFSWAAKLPFAPTTPEDFRSHLILFAINDQGRDGRDAVIWLQELCREAGAAGVETATALREIAALCSDEDKYGMGSTRALLLKRAEQEKPPGSEARRL